jgi:hypothetical protein
MMSHRAQSAAIMHAILPVGDMNPRSPWISRAAGSVVCAMDLDVVCAGLDVALADRVSVDPLPHAARTRTTVNPATAARRRCAIARP